MRYNNYNTKVHLSQLNTIVDSGSKSVAST